MQDTAKPCGACDEKSENISNIDIFCALTDDDETNLMSSLIAKKMGAKKN